MKILRTTHFHYAHKIKTTFWMFDCSFSIFSCNISIKTIEIYPFCFESESRISMNGTKIYIVLFNKYRYIILFWPWICCGKALVFLNHIAASTHHLFTLDVHSCVYRWNFSIVFMFTFTFTPNCHWKVG